MFDIKWIRANAEAFDAAVSRRKGISVRASDLLAIDDRRRDIITRLNDAQEKRNALSKQIGQAKAQKDEAKAQELRLIRRQEAGDGLLNGRDQVQRWLVGHGTRLSVF